MSKAESKEFNKFDDLKFRFKSSLESNMKDGDENEELVTHALIVEQLKENANPQDKEIELKPTSADAATEYSWGFLLWSFMHFGADNAITGHPGYWLSKANRPHDYWSAIFDEPKLIDVVEIQWRYAPKRMKIFYKLDESKDWVGATEVFIKEVVKDKHGNAIPLRGAPNYTIYFKKQLLCSQFKIMMNEPLEKKSFSINKVRFFAKVNRGIIMAPLVNEKIWHCWYINTNIVRKTTPIFVYPCTMGISVPHSNELFAVQTNKQIKPLNSDLCVGYDKKTSDLILNECTELSSATKIFYNDDYSMYFNGMKDKPIAVDTKNKNVNLINENTTVTVSSEADVAEFKKENLLNEGNSHWESAAGKPDVTIQLHFGKINCDDCYEKGKYESRKIDMIRIKWEKEPTKFSVFLWNPGQSWKSVATFDNYSDKMTNIKLTQETAAGVMIRITEGHKYGELGNQVAYGITSVGVFFNGSKLFVKESVKVPTPNKIFDFESQEVLYKQIGNDLENNLKDLGNNYEKGISTYKKMKMSIPSVETGKELNKSLCKKLLKLNEVVKNEEMDKLDKYKREQIKKIRTTKFYKYLKKFDDQDALENILGIKTKGQDEDDDVSKSNPLNSLTSLLTANKQAGGPSKKSVKNLPTKTDEDLKEDEEDFGSYENPAPNCMQIKLINKVALSGYYFIQPDCADIPLRAFCDFALHEVAVDIVIYKAGSVLHTPDLSYLHIKTPEDVRDQCAQVGLLPIDVKNRDMTQRIQNVLNASGMELNYPVFVPLGYDYSCSGIKCADIFNSLNKSKSDPIMKFFNGKPKTPKKPKTQYQFVGLGDPDVMKMTRYNEKKMKLSALICSTNITNEKQVSQKFKTVDCDFTLNANLDVFITNREVNLICGKGCGLSKEEVYGSGTYNGKSSICKAAIHAGEMDEIGGKITVRVDKPIDQYGGTYANGVKSLVAPGDGSKSFILFKYKPDCPNKNKKSSFITEQEDVFLDNEKILEEAMNQGNKDIDINSFVEKISNEKPLNKQDLINNNLIPQLSTLQGKNVKNDLPNKSDKYRFNQKDKFPSLPGLPSVPSALNSGLISDAASVASSAASAGKDALGDISGALSGLFGGKNGDGSGKDENAAKGAAEPVPSATGKFEPPKDLMTNTLSSPALPRTFSEEQKSNLLPAMSSPQAHVDPNTLTSYNKPSSDDPPKATLPPDSNGGTPDPPQAVETELKPKGEGPEKTDLKAQGPEARRNAPDPTDLIPDKQENNEGKGEDDDDEKKINKAIPTNVDKSKAETTAISVSRLNVTYNSGYFNYLSGLTKKMNKINEQIGQYIANSGPLYGNANLNLNYCEGGKCFSDGCNITNLPQIYDIILEKSKKMDSLIKKLIDRINARIYKTKDIKFRWRSSYEELLNRDAVKIDYSIYPNADIATEVIFTDIFQTQKLGTQKILNPTKWTVNTRGIKGRPNVCSVEFLPTDPTNGSSNLVLREKMFFDFKASFDVLLAESGTVSINFRVIDNFNYYSFIIDKKSGNKILSKNINGNMEIISTINDGAITINQWHTVQIETMGSKIDIVMFDTDNKKQSTKAIQAFDSSFVRGTMGFNVSGVTGFYFDNFKIEPKACWTAWYPKEDLVIKNPNSSILVEDFNGSMLDFYTIYNTDEAETKEGPAFWSFKDGGSFEADYLLQESPVYDSTPRKKPNYVILNNKNFQHGTFIVKFTPLQSDGIMSIIFKYIKNGNDEQYFQFELNNERDNPTFDLKHVTPKEVRVLASKDASQINDFRKKAYLPNKLNFVKIDVINEKITINVSHDFRDLIQVINIKSDLYQGGQIGFGTYKCPVKISTVTLTPHSMNMTPGDVNKVLTTSPSRLFSTTPFPSPKKIEDLHVREGSHGRSLGADAIENIKNQITRFSSSLGYNFGSEKDKDSNDSKNKNDNKDSKNGGNNANSEKVDNDNELAEWKTCVGARSITAKKTWCSNTFSGGLLRSKCEENFCDTCCDRSTAPAQRNIAHMCKKGCYRAAIAVDENKDYYNVCINSPNNRSNIYNFCDEKFDTYNPLLLNICKLDMCNMCCTGMDAIKKKNYSVPNLKACFKDCSKSYNKVLGEDKDVGTSKEGDVKADESEECSTPPKVNESDLNSEENNETSYLVKSYLKHDIK